MDENIDLKVQQKVLQGNISLVLDSYDAIFSDFDPRPYSERSVSDDFLVECRRAVHDKDGLEELRLLIPAHLRKPSEEVMVKRRLKDHFKKHVRETSHEIKRMKHNGLLWFFLGSILLIISTLMYEYKINVTGLLNFIFNFLFIISQPAGWFICWEGLERIFVLSNKKLDDLRFFKKMENAEIYFLNY